MLEFSINKVKQNHFNFIGSFHFNDFKYDAKYALRKLGDVVELLRGPFGSSIKKEVCTKSGFKIYEQGNVIKDDFSIGEYYIDKKKFEILKKFEIKENDVLLTCAGTLGKVAIVPRDHERGIINSVLMRLRIKENALLPKYLKYLLKSDIMQDKLVNQSFGTSIKNMRAGKEIKNLLIPAPTIKEQQKIVRELDDYRRIETNAKALIESYTPIFDISPSWKLKKLEEICKINEKNELIDADKLYSYIDIKSVENGGGGIISVTKIIKGKNLPSRARRKVNIGDVLVSTTRPYLKAFSFIESLPEDPIVSTGVAVLTPKQNMLGFFLYVSLLSHFVYEQIISKMNKTTYPSINDEDLKSLKIPIPSFKLQEKIVDELRLERDVVVQNRKLIQGLNKKIKRRLNLIWQSEEEEYVI